MAIRFCPLKTIFIPENLVNEDKLSYYFNELDYHSLIMVDKDNKFISCCLNSSNCPNQSKKIFFDYKISIDNDIFLNAHDIFFFNDNLEYIPVVNKNNEVIFYAFDDTEIEKAYEDILEMITFNMPYTFKEIVSKDKYIRIFGFNEISYYFHLMLEDQKVSHGVYGPIWDIICPKLHNKTTSIDTYDFLSEGNYGLPIEDMAYGKVVLEWHHIYYKGIYDYYKENCKYSYIISKPELQSSLSNKIDKNQPFMLGRIGNTELWILKEFLAKKKGLRKHYSYFWMDYLFLCCGFFANSKNEYIEEAVDQYAELTISALKDCDYNICWGDDDLAAGLSFVLSELCNKQSIKIAWDDLTSANCLYSQDTEKNALEGKKILIISPFVDTIKKQIEKKDLLFCKYDRMPNCNNVYYRALETQMGNTYDYKNWFDAYKKILNDISFIDFDIALIGAGSYGIPLAYGIKAMGKQALSLSSYLANWFGIKMKRYCTFLDINKYWNEHWIFPEETPPDGYKNIEGGCYWR